MPVPTDEEIDEFIEDALADKLGTLQRVRDRRERKIRTGTVALLFIFIPATFVATAVIGWDSGYGRFDFQALLIVPIVMAAIFGILYFALRQWFYWVDLPFRYKPDILAPLVHFIDPQIRYREEGGLSRDEVIESRFMGDDIQNFESRDFFRGRLRSGKLDVADISATSAASEGIDEFHGLFVAARVPVEFDGLTVITARLPEGRGTFKPREINDEVRDIEVDGLEEVRISSTAPEIAEILRNPAIIDRLARLRRIIADRGDDDFYLGLTGDRFFFALCDPDYFDRPNSVPLVDTTHLHRVGRELCAVIDLIEHLQFAHRP